ncbi:MAG TPA: hypothetical protein VGM14_07575 [Streptosporangiaceae bacterium]
MAAEPTRRTMIAAAAAGSLGLAGFLTGCKGIAALGPVPPVGADVVTLEHAISAEETMVAIYQAAVSQLGNTSITSGNGSDAQIVAAIRTEHVEHLRELRARLILPPRYAKTKPGANKHPAPPQLPADAKAVIAALAGYERSAAARLVGELVTAPAALAQLMASIAASESGHLVYLHQAGVA